MLVIPQNGSMNLEPDTGKQDKNRVKTRTLKEFEF